MGATFAVVDLSAPESPLQGAGAGTVDLDELRGQLEQIRDALTPVVAEQAAGQRMRVKGLELSLTVSLEGKIWFVAKGSGEASLKLTWEREGA